MVPLHVVHAVADGTHQAYDVYPAATITGSTKLVHLNITVRAVSSRSNTCWGQNAVAGVHIDLDRKRIA